ncbi:hypothetical protein [Flavobacterium sp. ov086]|uniref:hypothetical protein n=1 Tax=Flavobacterium sp. ov086 TaxID=1761785 RepID=UPI000B757138|nr:hypothetical protein [Flavobacterium sp. ov086]SNR60620.1 hypothetical protein SAMN04487979_11358 [Flavobacterium sp. ov086]
MKYIKLNLLFLLFCQIGISQTNVIDGLMIEGEKAYLDNNFLLAKEIYTKVTNLDSENKNGWYNLAGSELKLEENENACEHFYQAYLLNDGEALKLIKYNCPDFRNGSIMSINDVDEKPKFIYKKEEYLLIIDNSLNPKFSSLLMGRLKFSTIMSKYKGQASVQLQINNLNDLDVKILRVSGNQKEAEKIKKEILSVFKNLVTYVSAKNKGVNVDLWEKWSLTLNFLMVPYK